MTEYNRDRFDRGEHRHQHDEHRHDEPAARWRRGEERYRSEAYGAQSDRNRFDDSERYEAQRRNRDFGYGRAYRDDDVGGRSYGGNDWQENRTYNQRNYYAGRDYGSRADSQPVHWHEHDAQRHGGHRSDYGSTGDSSWFTGQQNSWAVGAPQVPSTYYGTTNYGADYRPHGYDADRDRDANDPGRRGFWDRASDEVASWFGDDDAARRREADHRGRGPKDYTRSDERIREDANDRLTDDWRVDASNVTVSVKDGELTLNGTVTSREAKRRAEDVVDSISGVKHVQNNLRVQEVSNWATNRTSTAEGGVASQSATGTTTKV